MRTSHHEANGIGSGVDGGNIHRSSQAPLDSLLPVVKKSARRRKLSTPQSDTLRNMFSQLVVDAPDGLLAIEKVKAVTFGEILQLFFDQRLIANKGFKE